MRQLTDKTGMLIHPKDVLKVFHYIGARRKKVYMYKWVTVRNDELYALHSGHLKPGEAEGYFLYPMADAKGRVKDTEILNRE